MPIPRGVMTVVEGCLFQLGFGLIRSGGRALLSERKIGMVETTSSRQPAAPDRLGLLCNEVLDANFLTAILYMVKPELQVDVLFSAKDIEAWAPSITQKTRLIAFCSSVVVTAEILGKLARPAYNFHPGPPEYPGKHPVAFALYDGATTFGATLHEMAFPVDSGPIAGVLQFPVPPGSPYLWLMARTHQAALHLFLQSVVALARPSEPLNHLPISWGARRCGQKALDEACRLPFDITTDELERRRNSFGQVPGANLYVMLQNRRFDLKP